MKLALGILEDAQAWVKRFFTPAGYGQIGLNAVTPISDFGPGTWREIPMDVELVPNPRGITYNLANNSMQFDVDGIWLLCIKVSLRFTEVNFGRDLQLRFFNKTDGTAGTTIFIEGVGRNSDTGSITFSVLSPGDTVIEGKEYSLEVSGNSSFTGVQCIGAIYGVTYQSEDRR